ncbi:MAG: HAD hydrolase-like protein [Oscillospiraceae bacterium]|nr:HAD hydrolase-like protein [Oscillospiraceae bacterium]
MRKYDYVIFDFDGTVTDTGEGILKSLQYSFEQMGDPVPDLSDLKKFIGPPIHYSFVTFYGVKEEDVGKYIEKYRERYRKIGIYECCLYDGMLDTLKKLKENGVKIGIASSKPVSLIYDVMNYLKITELFDAVVGTQFDDSNHSGKKDLVLQSMAELGADDKSRVLMVGDRYFDIDGAAGAGVDSCGVLFGYGNEQEFMEHGATYIVATAQEIVDIAISRK